MCYFTFEVVQTGIIAFTMTDVLFSNVINLWCVIYTLTATILIALLKDFALLASTKALIPFIKVPPIAAPVVTVLIPEQPWYGLNFSLLPVDHEPYLYTGHMRYL